MCGLAGYISNEATVDPRLSIALPLLGVFMTDRGKQSWGWSNGEDIYKDVGEFRTGFVGRLLGHQQALIHTRHATTGAKTKENSHPFAIKGIIGAHNGIINNHADIAKKYDLNYEVDSEVIFHTIADGRDLSELEGYGAVTFWQDGVFNIGRFNAGDMALVNTSFGWAFASTDKALADALAMAGLETTVNYQVDLKQGVLYQLIDDRIVRADVRLNISKSVSKTTWQNYGAPQWLNADFKPGHWDAETKTWTPGSYTKPSIPTITSGLPKNSLPLPTAETTTFKALDEQAEALLEQSMIEHQRKLDEQWAEGRFGSVPDCAWCDSLIVGEPSYYDDQDICEGCYLTLDAEDIAEDEARMLREDMFDEEEVEQLRLLDQTEMEEREDFDNPADDDDGRMYARDNDEVITDDFMWMSVNYANCGSEEVMCSECFDSIMDDRRVYTHQTLLDYNICGDCYTKQFHAAAILPAKIDLALIAA